ncbi:hypothetical protein [Bradyrhizobium valentinum]|uniref:hypothetical protein n=1 Tax=Bradyrhizobium valentinum TaxID=1518501 RepID=UPI000AE463F2|nr:hypothetical protein [Bradyrhizobium valentinum]
MAELVANAEMLIRRPVAEVFGRIAARLIDGRSARAANEYRRRGPKLAGTGDRRARAL